MIIEAISRQNLEPLTAHSLELWPECDFDEELHSWQNVLKSAEEICFLGKNDETFIGFIHLTIRTDYVEGAENDPTAYVEALFVKEEFRKIGIASKLLKKGEDWAKAKGLTQMASDTEIDNHRSIQFHNKAGFSEVNRIVCFIKNL